MDLCKSQTVPRRQSWPNWPLVKSRDVHRNEKTGELQTPVFPVRFLFLDLFQRLQRKMTFFKGRRHTSCRASQHGQPYARRHRSGPVLSSSAKSLQHSKNSRLNEDLDADSSLTKSQSRNLQRLAAPGESGRPRRAPFVKAVSLDYDRSYCSTRSTSSRQTIVRIENVKEYHLKSKVDIIELNELYFIYVLYYFAQEDSAGLCKTCQLEI